LSNVTTLEPATTNLTRFEQIFARLARGKEHREAFVDSEIDIGLPFQIKAIREARDWTQKELAEKSGKHQSVISQLETPGYGSLTLSTLRKLAAAYDVGLMVRFVSFSELARRASHLSDADMKIPSFSDDQTLTTTATTSRGEFIARTSTPARIFELDGTRHGALRVTQDGTTGASIYGTKERTN
jgi:transcriptional regulator with XRE-family HTH domain